jgi:L-lactate dehydrogenase complex protein LldF
MHNHAKNTKEFLDKSAWHNQALLYVRDKRDKAIKSVDEFESLRVAAKEIKDHTLNHLGYYIQEFEKNAKANGIKVLWAKDANEHNQIVHNILKSNNSKLVVKSKSMLTEECQLNPYLESKGIEVVDTDLGERIVQLAKQHPSHIVLPAIHLKKEEVSEIFHTHLHSQKGNYDEKYLTNVAREDLRQKFIKADAAITGVNFALANEGGFVVCTNEGNADMGTSLAPIHIASMGIEKLIPSIKELGVFTRLLARSATGQAITTYTSHFFKPKQNQQLYIIIVDNQRSDMIASPNKDALRCIRCGACMNTCPTFRRSGGHSYGYTIPGPIGTILASNKDISNNATLPFACSLCASCDNVCPSHIDLHHQIYTNRTQAINHPYYQSKKLGLRWMLWLLSHPKALRYAMKIYALALKYLPKQVIYNRFNIWGKDRVMPKAAKESFDEIYKRMQNEKC